MCGSSWCSLSGDGFGGDSEMAALSGTLQHPAQVPMRISTLKTQLSSELICDRR